MILNCIIYFLGSSWKLKKCIYICHIKKQKNDYKIKQNAYDDV